MNTQEHTLCADCSEIVSQGYTDNIDDTEHQNRCNKLDKEILKSGWYWLETSKIDADSFFEKCECCGVNGAQHTNYSASLT